MIQAENLNIYTASDLGRGLNVLVVDFVIGEKTIGVTVPVEPNMEKTFFTAITALKERIKNEQQQ